MSFKDKDELGEGRVWGLGFEESRIGMWSSCVLGVVEVWKEVVSCCFEIG